ncbi:hypothetical protein JS756_30810 [Streptomyces actuosus]|uniref:Golvesin/Xly CBD-like domain-containing protein n=1 Tax=Streptomyces actuosus TaxID=1885 RepID=A0ABS2VZ40_STRAS|nr:hypothetical protein [Streptomyces actuosus]MBN0048417.1 hypothetical protein [Streptomyces actuosus]
MTLGKGWNTSQDRAVTAAADADGLHILVADSKQAYAWKTAAILAEPRMPADSWIGNQCLMDHDHTAVVYAPRTFTNKPDLFQGGAFTAIVNTSTGTVTKLGFTASLAYFDPTCNSSARTAAFTAYRDMNDPAKTKTRVVTVNTAGRQLTEASVKGEVTSAAPVTGGAVGAWGRDLVRLTDTGKSKTGRTKTLTSADAVAFDIRPLDTGGKKIAFIERGTKEHTAKVWRGHGKAATVASGKPGALGLATGGPGKAYLTGKTSGAVHTKGTGITQIDVAADVDVSTQGRLAVDPVLTPGMKAGLKRIQKAGRDFTKSEQAKAVPESDGQAVSPKALAKTEPTTITSTATTTGIEVTQKVTPQAAAGTEKSSPALGKSSKPVTEEAPAGLDEQMERTTPATSAAAAASAHDPTDPDRWCSVSRNDVNAQALQPTPNQVEWAVDMAVRGDLTSGYIRQGDYRAQAGLGTVDPQGLFPRPTLNGDAGARIPANVLLGILAQESNLWQAESGAVPGQMGSPLAAVDGYYGHQAGGAVADYWKIHWDKSDCGYGVGQVTDGMRTAGHEKTGETSLSPAKQKIVAVDYASNIAASMKILADKWNEVHTDGQMVTVNNDDPSRVENWFTAAWNYNLGFNAPGAPNSPWGLGWYNNPANPVYKNDNPFMDTVADPDANHDAAHPQDWPYEEKVMGWAAWSIDTGFSYGTSGRQDWKGESGFSSAGFRPAWWVTDLQRSYVQPPKSTFCNEHNGCDPLDPPHCPDAACYTQYWWNQSNATWKDDCDRSCGHENIKYQTLIREPGRGYRLKNGTPVCSGAPSGATVVASVPNGTPTWSDCGAIKSDGTFRFTFYPDSDGRFEAKADLHQIGGGYGGHFWYTHTRNQDHLGGTTSGAMTVRGSWIPNGTFDLAKVYVHVPDTGAQTKQAHYTVSGVAGGAREVMVDQDGNNNKWVPLGAYKFTGTPSVTLSNYTDGGTADTDIAYGAVAFQPVHGTYVSDTLEADAFFDEDQNIDVRPESGIFDTPMKSRQALHDWALDVSGKITALPTCIDTVGSPACVKPETKASAERWRHEVTTAGTSTTDHPDGHSIPVWMHYANPYTKRPTSDSRPDWFGSDDGAYKLYNKATVSYVKTTDGKIVQGSESVSYDDRTADTHIPDFVREFFAALQKDYGTTPPDLNYTTTNLNVHDGRTTTTTTNSDGILPGRAYKSIGVKPVITDSNDNLVTDATGTCVAVMHTSGGSIGYRSALANRSLTDSVQDWVNRVSRDTGSSDNPMALMSQEIRNMFFKPGLTGSIFGQAPPIWQELDFKSCADGTVKRVSGAPILRSSYMPSQYLYRNGKAIDLSGASTGSSAPITTGDFYHFSGPASPPTTDDPYANCTMTGGHSGNPWDIAVYAPDPKPGIDPDTAHFCNAPDKTPDAQYTR